jgi:hypothetical protein
MEPAPRTEPPVLVTLSAALRPHHDHLHICQMSALAQLILLE